MALVVTGLPAELTEQHVRDLLGSLGPLSSFTLTVSVLRLCGACTCAPGMVAIRLMYSMPRSLLILL